MQRLQQFASLMVDRRVPLVSKLAFFGLAGGYVLFPVDLLPDILPLVGIVDDSAVLLTAMTLFIRYGRKRIEEDELVRETEENT